MITGGGGPDSETEVLSSVSLYNNNGFVRVMPSMNSPRRGHACASYNDDIGQVFLVAGGFDGSRILSTSETLQQGSNQWKQIASLPHRSGSGLRGITIDNNVFLLGNHEAYLLVQTIICCRRCGQLNLQHHSSIPPSE